MQKKFDLKRMPKIWPFYNIVRILFDDLTEQKEARKIKHSAIMESINRELMVIFYILYAAIVYKCTYPLNFDISTNWGLFTYITTVIVRDLLTVLIFFGGFHYLLYENPIYVHKMRCNKFNKMYPDQAQWSKDRFWTLIGCVVTSFYEIILYLYFKDWLYNSFWKYPLYSMFWLWFIGSIRAIHFYFSHRMIHPWKRKIFGFDIGVWLYQNIHKFHHQSVNIGPWSGLSMHPMEHILYFSSIPIPIIFGVQQHFVHILCHKFSSLLVPIISHDGYDDPGAGSLFHYLHHVRFECNYGTTHWLFNFDKVFGTYNNGIKFRMQKAARIASIAMLWKKQPESSTQKGK
eukprot:227419_1